MISFIKNILRPGVRAYYAKKMTKLQVNIGKELRRASDADGAALIAIPDRFGKAMPERVVELALAKSLYRPGTRVLDVGHANAMKCHLDMLSVLPEPLNITGIDIAQPVYEWSKYYARSVIGDMAATSFCDSSFDLIWCISALEHFGMDNTGYLPGAVPSIAADERAICEIFRILASGGVALITVPFGKSEDHGWLRQYDKEQLDALTSALPSSARVDTQLFKYHRSHGWKRAEPEELEQVGYFDGQNNGAAGLAAVMISKSQDGLEA